MLEDVAAYLILAPLAATLALGAAAAVWLTYRRLTPARIRIRAHTRDRR